MMINSDDKSVIKTPLTPTEPNQANTNRIHGVMSLTDRNHNANRSVADNAANPPYNSSDPEQVEEERQKKQGQRTKYPENAIDIRHSVILIMTQASPSPSPHRIIQTPTKNKLQ